ncbi:MAG TPA: acyltransferase [Xanthobacteraceae bacterium]|nr:acyltransferase [Xanthobacteraceae bacterium]
MSKTSLALGNFRGYSILIVLGFHSVIAYIVSQPAAPLPFDSPPYGWLANPIVDPDRWLGFDLFCATQFLYMMQLMFFLSGLFVWPSLQRKGARAFLYDRFLRLGLPFVLGVSLLMPVAYYPVYRLTAADPGWSEFLPHWLALPFWPSGPLWFLWLVLAFNVVAAGLYRLVPRAGEVFARLSARAGSDPIRFFIVLAAISALAYVPLARVYPPWQWVGFGPFHVQASFAPQYAIYFFAGLVIGTHRLDRGLLAADGMVARRWGRWMLGAFAAFLLWIIPTALTVKGEGAPLPGLQIAADLAVPLYAAAACIGLAAIFLRFAAVRRPVLNGLSENAYGMYLFHYVFVIWTQYALYDVALPGIAKGAIVFSVTLVLSWATTAAVCRTSIGERVIGGRRAEPAAAKRALSPEPNQPVA